MIVFSLLFVDLFELPHFPKYDYVFMLLMYCDSKMLSYWTYIRAYNACTLDDWPNKNVKLRPKKNRVQHHAWNINTSDAALVKAANTTCISIYLYNLVLTLVYGLKFTYNLAHSFVYDQRRHWKGT